MHGILSLIRKRFTSLLTDVGAKIFATWCHDALNHQTLSDGIEWQQVGNVNANY